MPPLSTLTLGVFRDSVFAALQTGLTASDHPHPRARIRDWVAQRLRAGALAPGAIREDVVTLDIEELPVVNVFSVGEAEPPAPWEGPRELERVCQLVVDVGVAEKNLPGGLTLINVLDAFARVIELLLLNDRDAQLGLFGGLAHEIAGPATVIEVEEKGERLVFHARMEFRVTYPDELSVPVGNALEVVGVQWDLAPKDGAIDAEDEIHPPQ